MIWAFPACQNAPWEIIEMMTATLCGEESKEGKAHTDSRGGKEIIGESVDVSIDLGRHSRAPMATCVQISLHCLSSAVN